MEMDGEGAKHFGDAPTFMPEEEDLMRPLEYLRRVAADAAPYGIVRVQVPNRWSPSSKSPLDSDLSAALLRVRWSALPPPENDGGAASQYHRSVAEALRASHSSCEEFISQRSSSLRARAEELLPSVEQMDDTLRWSESAWEQAEALALEELFWSIASGSDEPWGTEWCPPTQAAEGSPVPSDDGVLSAPPESPSSQPQQSQLQPNDPNAAPSAAPASSQPQAQSGRKRFSTATGFSPMRGGARHPMDIMRFGNDRGNLLSLVGNNTLPVRRTELEVGSTLSYTPWTLPAHALMYLHYIHSGCSKTWYCSAGKDAASAIVQNGLIGSLASCSHLSEHHGITTTRVVQTPGTFVLICPGNVYQCFNHGPLLAEGATIGSPEWLPEGRAAVERQRAGHTSAKAHSFSHEELIVRLAKSFLEEDSYSRQPKHASKRRKTSEAVGGDDDVEKETGYAEQLLGEVKAVGEQENIMRKRLEQQRSLSRSSGESVAHAPKGEPCEACGARVYASVIRCKAHPNTSVCLLHPEYGCNCPGRYLCCRVSDSEFERLANRLTQYLDHGSTRQVSSSKRTSKPTNLGQMQTL